MAEDAPGQKSKIVLDYAIKSLEDVPDWHPDAERVIDRGSYPVEIRKYFKRPKFAAQYYANSMTRRYGLDQLGDQCTNCSVFAPEFAAKVGWWIELQSPWPSFFHQVSMPSRFQTHHAICLKCYRGWKRRSREIAFIIIGGGTLFVALILLAGVSTIIGAGTSWPRALLSMLIGLIVVGFVCVRTLDLIAWRQWPRAVGRLLLPGIRHHGEVSLVRRASYEDGIAVASPVKVVMAMKSDWIEILPKAMPSLQAIDFVTDARAGGIDVFYGTTREEKSLDGRELLALDYEAYEQMALDQMKALAARARQTWPIVKLAMLHRVGRVELGAPSVVIAVSTPHRAEAFEACRYLIDELKRDIAIWKKEVWSDGSASWVHPQLKGDS